MIWLDSRKNISDREHSTRFMYECYIKALTKFFGGMRLEECADIGPIAAYQKERSSGLIPGLRRAGASLVNHELNTLQQILTRAGLWSKVRDWYEQLPAKPSTRGRALSEEEERRLFRVAKERGRWLVAYCCALISVNSTADPGEIRHLKLQDVELDRRMFHIREGLKTGFRARTIPMSTDSHWAFTTLLQRALEKGSIYPHHYLLPRLKRGTGGGYDPITPQGDWRTAWENLREAAGLPGLRLKDLRHHSITKMLENPNISERTVIEMAGHVSNKMLDTYSHQRVEAKVRAVEVLDGGYTQQSEQPRPILATSFTVRKTLKPKILQGDEAAAE